MEILILNRVKKDGIYPSVKIIITMEKVSKAAGRSGKSWHWYEVSDGHHRWRTRMCPAVSGNRFPPVLKCPGNT